MFRKKKMFMQFWNIFFLSDTFNMLLLATIAPSGFSIPLLNQLNSVKSILFLISEAFWDGPNFFPQQIYGP